MRDGRQEIAKQYDEELQDYVIAQSTTNGLNHNYHKYMLLDYKIKEVKSS